MVKRCLLNDTFLFYPILSIDETQKAFCFLHFNFTNIIYTNSFKIKKHLTTSEVYIILIIVSDVKTKKS